MTNNNLLIKTGLLLIALGLLFTFAAPVSSMPDIHDRPTVIVRPSAQVRGLKIHLGDIADITAQAKAFAPVVERLKTLELGDSPAPRTHLTLLGQNVLSAIKGAGVIIEEIG